MTPRQGQLEVDGASVRYSETGDGGRVVILDSGAGDMPRLQQALSVNNRALRLELPISGNGRPIAAKELGRLAASVVGQLTDETYTLVGASAAADAALWQTLHTPETVESVILISPLSILPKGGETDAEAESRLAEIPCAALAVFGLNDEIVAPQAARVYREKIGNGNISLVYDAGHDIMADRPQVLIDLVADFVERRETFVVAQHSSVVNP